MATSSRIDRNERDANRCAEDVTLTDLEATVDTYRLRSYVCEQPRSDWYTRRRDEAASVN